MPIQSSNRQRMPSTMPRIISGRSINSAFDDDLDIASITTLQLRLSEYMEQESIHYHEMYPGAEMIDYDFTADRVRHNLYGTNLVESTAHLVKGCLGIGILGIHEGFKHGGIWTSLAATLVIGITASYSMLMLVKSAHKMYPKLRVPMLSYPDLAEVAVATGPWKKIRKHSKRFRYIVEMCLFLLLCGTCCIYEVVTAYTLKHLLESVSETVKVWDLGMRIYILITSVPLFLLCLIKSLKYLAPFSFLADLFVLLCVIATMYYSIEAASSISLRPPWKSVGGLFRFSGVCMYTLEGIGVVMPIENHMKRPQYFSTILVFGMSIVVTFTTLIGFFGYWGWGEKSKAPFTLHMPENIFTLTLQGLLSTMLCISFAVNFWVPFKIVWYYIGQRYTRRRRRYCWERSLRALQVIAITILALIFPYLSELMVFMGNFFLGLVGFVFPPIIDSLVTWRDARKTKVRWRFIRNIAIIIFGSLLCCGSLPTLL